MDWAVQKAALANAKAKAAAAIAAIDVAVTGFQHAPYEKRCAAGATVHDNFLHITQGWSPGTPSLPFVASHFRTPDFIRAEKAVGDLQMYRCVMNELASFDGKLFRSSGLDTLPLTYGDDAVNDHIYASDTGAAPWVLEPGRPTGALIPKECGVLHAFNSASYGDILIDGMGEAYNPAPPPTYHMRTALYRRSTAGAWAHHAAIPFRRRNFAYFTFGGLPYWAGGADDLRDPPLSADYRTVYGDLIRFDADYQNPINLGSYPFGPAYGRKAALMSGHVVLTGGAKGDGTFSTQVSFTKEVWASNDPENPSSWFRLADLPEALNHHAVGVLTIDGVETLGVIGGYNNLAYSGGGPIGKIWTLGGLTGTWQARTDSDFWVD
jgi:hypothetical protein